MIIIIETKKNFHGVHMGLFSSLSSTFWSSGGLSRRWWLCNKRRTNVANKLGMVFSMEGNPVSGMLGLGISSFSENNNLESNLFTNLPMKSPKSKKEQWDTILIQFLPYRAFSSTITSSTVPYFAFFVIAVVFICFVLFYPDLVWRHA